MEYFIPVPLKVMLPYYYIGCPHYLMPPGSRIPPQKKKKKTRVQDTILAPLLRDGTTRYSTTIIIIIIIICKPSHLPHFVLFVLFFFLSNNSKLTKKNMLSLSSVSKIWLSKSCSRSYDPTILQSYLSKTIQIFQGSLRLFKIGGIV